MKHDIVSLLTSGQIRPRRVYNGEYVASKCGRFVTRLGSRGAGAMAAPNGVVITNDPQMFELASRNGYLAHLVPGFSREKLAEERKSNGRKQVVQALTWMMDKEGGQQASGMPSSGAPQRRQRSEPDSGVFDQLMEPRLTSIPMEWLEEPQLAPSVEPRVGATRFQTFVNPNTTSAGSSGSSRRRGRER